MSKKFEKIVNGPHRAFGNARKNIARIHTQTKKGAAAKYTGAGVAGMIEFLLWAGKYAVLDNHVTRAMEKRFAKKSKDSFAKKYPNLSSHMMYYMMLAASVIAGPKAYEAFSEAEFHSNEQPDSTRQEIVQPTVTAFSTKQEVLDLYWNAIAIGLTELETYRPSPKIHRGEVRATNGLGVTYYYTRDANGKISRKNATLKTPAMSYDKNYEQVRMHLEYETLRSLVNAKKKYPNLTDQQVVALVWAGFQRPADIMRISSRLHTAQTPQQIADAFQDMGGLSPDGPWGKGTLKRRWICGAYAAGVVTLDDLLNMDRDAFSKVEINNIMRKKHFLLGGQTVKFVLGRKNSNNTVRQFLAGFDTGRKILAGEKAVVHVHTMVGFEDNSENAAIENSMRLLNKGEADFKNKKYKNAADLFAQAIKIDPDNMEAYSSLALAYKRMGDKNKSIQYYEKCCDVVRECNARMDQNKSLLLDYDVKAASYYNAGRAYEAIAEIYQARGDNLRAQQNYAQALQAYEAAKQNCARGGAGKKRMDTYDQAVKNMKKKVGNKKTSFLDASKKLGNHAHSVDFDLSVLARMGRDA